MTDLVKEKQRAVMASSSPPPFPQVWERTLHGMEGSPKEKGWDMSWIEEEGVCVAEEDGLYLLCGET